MIATAPLAGTAAYAGSDPLAINWLKWQGPSGDGFANGTALSTTARFDRVGAYTLMLHASDGYAQSEDTIEITLETGSNLLLAYEANGATSGSAPVDPASPYLANVRHRRRAGQSVENRLWFQRLEHPEQWFGHGI